MPLFPDSQPDSLYISRDDPEELLSAYAKYDFELDGAQWPSVEHYYQAMKFEDPEYREKIRRAAHPKTARRWGRNPLKRPRKDWADIRETVMTRAVYIRARTHDEVAQRLLDTGEQVLIERSLYDYYWGCGRDGRGHNKYGKVLMNVREKLKELALP